MLTSEWIPAIIAALGTAASSRMQQSPNTVPSEIETLAFTRPTRNDGLHLGL